MAEDDASGKRAREWLARAREQGADVALIARLPAAVGGCAPGRLHTCALGRLSLLHLIRAIDAEMQLRTIDALIGFGPRAERLLANVPRAVRGAAPSLSEAAVSEPERTIRQALASRPPAAPR